MPPQAKVSLSMFRRFALLNATIPSLASKSRESGSTPCGKKELQCLSDNNKFISFLNRHVNVLSVSHTHLLVDDDEALVVPVAHLFLQLDDLVDARIDEGALRRHQLLPLCRALVEEPGVHFTADKTSPIQVNFVFTLLTCDFVQTVAQELVFTDLSMSNRIQNVCIRAVNFSPLSGDPMSVSDIEVSLALSNSMN